MPTDLILNREQSRRVDELAVDRYGMSGLVLMENAGRGAAEIIADLYHGLGPSPLPITICCGKGNNGGDGFVIARHLDNRGLPVRLLVCCDPATLTGDAAANYEIAFRSGLAIEVFSENPLPSPLAGEGPGVRGSGADDFHYLLGESALIIDALLGTGAQGEPRPPIDQAIDAINHAGRPVVAIDVPSGLDCDTGEAAQHTIRAAHTITFVAKKPGFLKPEAAPYVGKLHVVDIGVPRKLLEEITSVS